MSQQPPLHYKKEDHDYTITKQTDYGDQVEDKGSFITTETSVLTIKNEEVYFKMEVDPEFVTVGNESDENMSNNSLQDEKEDSDYTIAKQTASRDRVEEKLSCMRTSTSELNIEYEQVQIKMEEEEFLEEGKYTEIKENYPKPQQSFCKDLGNLQCVCIVGKLLKKPFSEHTHKEQRDIISLDRHMPQINLETNGENSKINPYVDYEWLTGCQTLSKLFCWPCLLFNASENPAWDIHRCSDSVNFVKNITRHTISVEHLRATVKEKIFKTSCREQRADFEVTSDVSHNALVKTNRYMVKRLIDVVCVLGERGVFECCVDGHDADGDSPNEGPYTDFMELMGKYDETVKYQLANPTSFQATSKRLQCVLIGCVTNVVMSYLKDEVRKASFVSLVLSETRLGQFAVVVRYVKAGGGPRERFLGFTDVTKDTNLEKTVCDIVGDLRCGSKFIAQSYDGGIVHTKDLETLQRKVKQEYKNAVFVHSVSHRLDLVLMKVLRPIHSCKLFFSILSGLAGFFSDNSTRCGGILVPLVQGALLELISTRWEYDGRFVRIVSENFSAITKLFRDILDNPNKYCDDTIYSANTYLMILDNDFDFNFLLNAFSKIFLEAAILSDTLQTKSNDIAACVQSISSFEECLSRTSEQFEYFWQKTTSSNNLEPRKTDDAEARYRQLFLEILDAIREHLRVRFAGFKHLAFVELCNFSGYGPWWFPEQAYDSLKLHYDDMFDHPALRSQLTVLYEISQVGKQDTALDMLNFLRETGLDGTYSEVVKLCQLVLSFPGVALLGGGFSVLKRIDGLGGGPMIEEKLSDSAVLSVESEAVKELTQCSKFYDDVIEEFAKVEEKIQLRYK